MVATKALGLNPIVIGPVAPIAPRSASPSISKKAG